MTLNLEICESCKESFDALYESPEGKFVCYFCLEDILDKIAEAEDFDNEEIDEK